MRYVQSITRIIFILTAAFVADFILANTIKAYDLTQYELDEERIIYWDEAVPNKEDTHPHIRNYIISLKGGDLNACRVEPVCQ